MTQLHQKFMIHPVGQGFFYSGAIEFHHPDNTTSNFNFVFDCGSMNKANCADEISTYHTHHFPDDTSLDLLVISHFDQDHVNHIYKLLEGKRKVKKIVAPFLDFSERFLLFLRWTSFPGPLTTGPEELFFISIILDPVAALTPLLDDKEGEIIFITSDPDNPPFIVSNPEGKPPTEGKDRIFHLDFGALKDISGEATGVRVKEVPDSERATLKFGSIPVMEFLFYKKEIGKGEEEFYRKVHELFMAKYAASFIDPEKPLPEEITGVIKTIRTATVIKKLFNDAKKILKFEAYKHTEISDLNTSALCMLHRNMDNLRPTDYHGRYFPDIEINRIQKFEQLPPSFSRIVKPFEHWDRYRWFHQENFPNVLLTSDSFLLTKTDVDAFYNRYKNYWNQYWIFQVPHHGSDNNTDVTLLSRIPHATEIFINYGIVKAWGGTWRHPSAQVITDIVATGHSLHFSPVNESAGIEFSYTHYR